MKLSIAVQRAEFWVKVDRNIEDASAHVLAWHAWYRNLVVCASIEVEHQLTIAKQSVDTLTLAST